MKRSGRQKRKSHKKSQEKSHKKYSKKYKKKSQVKKHNIIKLAEPIREDVEKIVKNSGYGFIKTALITATVAALLYAGANKYDIKPITKMVAPHVVNVVDNKSPQVNMNEIINKTVEKFPEANVVNALTVLSKVDSTDIINIARDSVLSKVELKGPYQQTIKYTDSKDIANDILVQFGLALVIATSIFGEYCRHKLAQIKNE